MFSLESKKSLKPPFPVLVFLFVFLSLISCRHEPDLATVPEVSFSERVLPIIQSNCGKSGCHDGSDELFALVSYEDVRGRVVAKKPHQSELYKNMIYLEDFRVMPPPPDQPLSEEQLQLVYTWIMQGAKNN